MTNPSTSEPIGGGGGGGQGKTTAAAAAVSFGFSKKSGLAKKLQDSELRDESTKAESSEKDFVVGVNRKGIEGSKLKPNNELLLVIPCSGNNKHQARGARRKVAADDNLSQEDRDAARELLKESAEWLEGRGSEETADGCSSSLMIPLDGEKESLFRDLESMAESSGLDDYEAVPVRGFGMGMLRGMGFKKEEGIGGFKKAAVACVEPNVRPKGLGLGAARPNAGGKGKMAVRKGAHVVVEGGTHKSCYGKVEGLDEENGRVVVKLLSAGGGSVSVSENVVRVVDKEEHRRVVDKEECEKRRRKRSRSRSPPAVNKKKPRTTWLRPHLRVRIIDKRFKGGRYYGAKVVVEDVASPGSCVVRTEEGGIVEDVDPAFCETVIPRRETAVVMIVRGERKGVAGRVLGKDKRSCRAAVQLLPDGKEVLKVDYDDICEFVGDVANLE